MLKQRVIAGVILAPLGIAAILWLPNQAFLWLAGAVFTAGAWEWARLSGWDATGPRAAYTVLVAATLAALGWLGSNQLWGASVGAGAIAWLVAALWLSRFTAGQSANSTNTLVKALLGWIMLAACFSAVAQLRSVPDDGAMWVLVALATVWITDTAAYFTGRAIGKRKLAPRISPNKTWAGAMGALVGSLLFLFVATTYLLKENIELWELGVLAALTATVAMVGDLFVSLLKRHRDIKDSGNLIPGHGGILDRFDGVLAAVPAFVLAKSLLTL